MVRLAATVRLDPGGYDAREHIPTLGFGERRAEQPELPEPEPFSHPERDGGSYHRPDDPEPWEVGGSSPRD